jgi:hypothetical protein
MTKRQKILLSALVVGALGSVAALGVYALFTATTQNSGNEISSGTVALTDNDSGSALYNLTGQRPGDTASRCIRTTYTGSLPAAVRVYASAAVGPLAQYIDLTITQGTQQSSTFPSCTNFAPDAAGVLFSGTLQSFETAHSTYAAGVATAPSGQPGWNEGNSVVYRFQTTLQAATPDSSQGATSGVHAFVWEARNQ